MIRQATDRLPVAIGLSVISALIAVLAGYAEVALFASPWVVLFVFGSSRSAQPEIEVSMSVSNDRLMVGDQTELSVTVASRHSVSLKVLPQPVEEFWPGSVPVDERTVVPQADAIGTRDAADFVFELEAHEWGTHDLGRARLEMTPAHGLFRFSSDVAQSCPVRVHPTPTQLRELLTPWLVRRVSGTHPSTEASRGVEYADLREFAAGDSLRDINWRASARSTELMVSQRHPDRATDVVLLVDSFVESGHDVRGVFSSVIEAAVALAESHLGATDRVGLVEFGGLVRWVSPSTGRIQLQRLTDALLATGLYANAAEKPLPMLSPRALPPRSFLIALTPLLDQRFIDAIFTARSRGHDVAVIACLAKDVPAEDPTPAELLSRQLRDAEQAMLRDTLVEQGIIVVQWAPTDHLDTAIGELLRRRRRAPRIRAR